VKNFHADQKYKKLKRKCRKAGTLFEDDKFSPSGLLLTNSSSGFETISYFRSKYKIREIKWLRPHEICQKLREDGELKEDDLPEMEIGERNRFDINQGELGDCWFLAPLALLAESKAYNKVVPPGQGFKKGYQGIFRFRFYRLGEWIEVVIDDRLPTRNGKLIYLRGSTPNQFWSPLLEKAYAKLNGSYAALEGGLSIHAAVDFTGGIPKIIDIEDKPEDPKSLFHLIKLTIKNNGLITCSLGHQNRNLAERLGLQGNHSYSVTKVVEVWSKESKESIPLIRLRNPHGNGKEWVGDWGDSSSQWKTISNRKKKKIGLEVDTDGEFYMNFHRDFLNLFGSIDIVHINPIRMELSQKKVIRKFNLLQSWGSWEYNTSDGGVDNLKINPRYFFNLSRRLKSGQDCCVIVSLAQQVLRKKSEHHIGFRIYKYENIEELSEPDFFKYVRNLAGSSGVFVNSREVSETFHLEEGKYCVIPTTYHRYKIAKFHLRIYLEYRWKVESASNNVVIRDKSCFFWCWQSFIRCTCCSTYCYPHCCSNTSKSTSSKCGSSSCCLPTHCCKLPSSCCKKTSSPSTTLHSSKETASSRCGFLRCCRKTNSKAEHTAVNNISTTVANHINNGNVVGKTGGRSGGCCQPPPTGSCCGGGCECCCRCSASCCPGCRCCCCCVDDDDYYYKAGSRSDPAERIRMIPIQHLNQSSDAVDGAKGFDRHNQLIKSHQSGGRQAQPLVVYSRQVSSEIQHFYQWTTDSNHDSRIISEIKGLPNRR